MVANERYSVLTISQVGCHDIEKKIFPNLKQVDELDVMIKGDDRCRMAELPFPMPNLLDFLMGKLCYDLKLEILEQMDPKDIIELMKSNKKFRAILINRPWMIFGEHVHSIIFRSMHIVEIKKHQGSSIFINLRCQSVLLKRITSCVQFIRRDIESDVEKETALEILGNDVRAFCNLQRKGGRANLLDLTWYTWNMDNENNRYLTNLFESQLDNCKEISMNGRGSQFYFLRQFLLKTNVRMIAFNVSEEQPPNQKSTDLVAGWIASRGIPSRNQYPSILLTFTPNNPLGNFLSATPGLQRIGELSSIRETLELRNEMCKKYPVPGMFVESHDSYKQKIDNERDCIYIVSTGSFGYTRGHFPLQFFAKYVPAQQQPKRME
ncbi:unnamed protein product, partial [Mesorhabditis belari]|uniref:F-box domain-containing protein n=1 Tax=Mesorhabditis belari TaxID=2138241 RepID=A0AAF3EXT9_9BILA